MLKIIGATGNVGKRLLEKSLEVWHDDVEAIATRLDEDELDYDFESLTHDDTIAFCAAISEPTVCANNPELARKVNVENTINFIQRSTEQGAKVVFLSSDAVYGDKTTTLDEQWDVDPIGVYGKMKAEVETHFIGNYNVKILRSSYNFFRQDRFTSYLEKCALNGEVAEVFSPFERAVIHREDTVDAILSLSRDWKGPQIINCGGPETVCRSEFASILKEEVFPNLEYKVVRPPEKFYKDRPSVVSMVSFPIKNILGRSQRSLRDAIRMEFGV
jgi:dTDP-4-dehydrorhamnose reductase